MAGRTDERASAALEASSGEGERQRLDKWLWFARVLKTRSLAAKLVGDGHVRVNGARTDQASKQVKTGDVLTIALERTVRVLRIRAPGARRGPYAEAQTLYDDLTAPPDPAEAPVHPGRRPDRDERRALERLKRGQ